MRSLWSTAIIAAICTGVGMFAGVRLLGPSEPPMINAPCADAPMACAKRAAESRCGGPGTYQLLGKEAAGERMNFTFVCVATESI